MKKIFAALLAVLFITGAVLGCGKTPQTELNQAKQQAAEQVAKTAKSGLAQLQGKQAQFKVEEGRAYTGKAEVALYIHTFHKLPGNFITKREAERLGWKHKGTLNEVAPGKSIGGDRYGNYAKDYCRRNQDAAGKNAILITKPVTGMLNVWCILMTD